MKTFFNNNYGVSIINNEFTQGVELAVLLGNESKFMIVDEEVFSGLDDADIDKIILDVSNRKALSNEKVEKIIELDLQKMLEMEDEIAENYMESVISKKYTLER